MAVTTEPTGRARSLTDRRAALAAAAEALAGLESALWQADGSELGELLGIADQLVTRGAAARVAVTSEAVSRGEVAATRWGSTRQWVAGHAPSLATGGAGLVARAVEELARPEHRQVRDAVLATRVSVVTGVRVVDEYRKIRPRLAEGADEPVIGGMLAIGATQGPIGVRRLRTALVARYGVDGELQREQDAAARHVELSQPVPEGDGIYSYRLVLDTPGMAVLEAAIGTLSRPAPEPDGTRDVRWPAQRRGQALVEVCRRATAAGSRPGSAPKTTLLVTMALDDLMGRIDAAPEGSAVGAAEGAPPDRGPRRGAGLTLGPVGSGDLIAPETVRRLACDAEVIPAVLGTDSELLDLGRATRLFTPAQTRALLLRDRACTFPGCDIPAHWCEAHHLPPWVHGGRSDLGNAALLCGRHHSVVHRDGLRGTVTAEGVRWDTTPGGYDRPIGTAHDPPWPRTADPPWPRARWRRTGGGPD